MTHRKASIKLLYWAPGFGKEKWMVVIANRDCTPAYRRVRKVDSLCFPVVVGVRPRASRISYNTWLVREGTVLTVIRKIEESVVIVFFILFFFVVFFVGRKVFVFTRVSADASVEMHYAPR